MDSSHLVPSPRTDDRHRRGRRRPASRHRTPGHLSYSTDGTTFTRLGPSFSLGNDWRFFMGHRFALFNHATQALDGAVRFTRFELTTP
ncbi:hypothetical protein [Streptomyces sp. NPDC005859]|uniref:hypothetical protein n=1 Tax=Streptomyces sp. NPDC005859 TaxID=3157170 RepID=UPI0034103032